MLIRYVDSRHPNHLNPRLNDGHALDLRILCLPSQRPPQGISSDKHQVRARIIASTGINGICYRRSVHLLDTHSQLLFFLAVQPARTHAHSLLPPVRRPRPARRATRAPAAQNSLGGKKESVIGALSNVPVTLAQQQLTRCISDLTEPIDLLSGLPSRTNKLFLVVYAGGECYFIGHWSHKISHHLSLQSFTPVHAPFASRRPRRHHPHRSLFPALRLHRSFAFVTVTTLRYCHWIVFVTLTAFAFLSSLYPSCLHRCHGLAFVVAVVVVVLPSLLSPPPYFR
jgi:hypothetical protein